MKQPENTNATFITSKHEVEFQMDEHVYKLIELVGTSTASVEEAVNNAVHRAGETLKNLRWFQIREIRGDIDHNKVAHWQVTVKAGFTVETSA